MHLPLHVFAFIHLLYSQVGEDVVNTKSLCHVRCHYCISISSLDFFFIRYFKLRNFGSMIFFFLQILNVYTIYSLIFQLCLLKKVVKALYKTSTFPSVFLRIGLYDWMFLYYKLMDEKNIQLQLLCQNYNRFYLLNKR